MFTCSRKDKKLWYFQTMENYAAVKINELQLHATVWMYLTNMMLMETVQFSRSVVSDSANPWIAARQASLSITNSRSSPKPMSIESVMPSSHLILCCPLLLLPPILPSIRVFSNESTLRMRWPKYWSFSFNKNKYCILYDSIYTK